MTLGSLIFLALAPGAASAAPVTVPGGVADAVDGEGTGLCAASAITTNPQGDFNLVNPGNYTEAINTFIEEHAADRSESVIRTLLDLSNNNASGLKLSYGDFIDAALPDCKTGGCDFFVNDGTTSFASRLRGFFNVTADLANKPIHFGFYADDAVSLTVYDKLGAAYPVIVRPPEFGMATWRVTNQVTFSTPGLYPIEILHAEILEHAALEMSYFIGDFTDIERAANDPPITKLSDAGFKLFQPTSFFQTPSGIPPYAALESCKQCDRQFVNQPGDSGCGVGYYCNEAALCSPCDSSKRCGATCSPCGGDTPLCLNVNGTLQCSGCSTDADCGDGFTCDTSTKACQASSSPAGAGGAGGAGGSGGAGSGGNDGGTEGGCDCRTEPRASSAGSAGLWALVIAAVGLARSRRRASRSSSR